MDETELQLLLRGVREVRERQLQAHVEEARQGAILDSLVRQLDGASEWLLSKLPNEAASE